MPDPLPACNPRFESKTEFAAQTTGRTKKPVLIIMRFLSFLVTGFFRSIVTVDLMNSKSTLTALALFPASSFGAITQTRDSSTFAFLYEIDVSPASQDLDGARTATDWFAGITGRATTDEYSAWRDGVTLYSAVTVTNPGFKQWRRHVYR